MLNEQTCLSEEFMPEPANIFTLIFAEMFKVFQGYVLESHTFFYNFYI